MNSFGLIVANIVKVVAPDELSHRVADMAGRVARQYEAEA